MDFMYRVDMKHQWRPGIGGFVDLNCGWYCQDALLNWYCNKNNLSYPLLKDKAKRSRLSYGFSPEDSFCHRIFLPRNIECYKYALLKYGPIIASGKIGMADFGFLGGVNHYVLITSVNIKHSKITIQDPLKFNWGRLGYSNYSIYDFYRTTDKINETLVINKYKISLFFGG
ncbi:TPA: kinesin [Escherichia coli]|nr:kinesin [Escherichia coli]ENC42532.1 kinesin family protein member 1/13/14 [Escherichia coli P0299917.10]EAA4632534.1 kinesin [Escherichia coli]EEW0004231.1 kinesin [Escherichia coli]EGE3162880.1 kinesin [Escherichia coli]